MGLKSEIVGKTHCISEMGSGKREATLKQPTKYIVSVCLFCVSKPESQIGDRRHAVKMRQLKPIRQYLPLTSLWKED